MRKQHGYLEFFSDSQYLSEVLIGEAANLDSDQATLYRGVACGQIGGILGDGEIHVYESALTEQQQNIALRPGEALWINADMRLAAQNQWLRHQALGMQANPDNPFDKFTRGLL